MRYEDLLDVLHEDNHLLVLNKPAGWSSAHDQNSMADVAKAYLKEKYNKPGNVFLGVVHRIDKPVSGVLVFARTSKAASRLSEQFRDHAVVKTYWAVCAKPTRCNGWALGETHSLQDWLSHDDDAHIVEVVNEDFPGAKLSKLHYTVKAEHDGQLFLELSPLTGRKHQLRVQLASRGAIIHGDRKYGSVASFGHAIALHARSITILHPTTSEPLTFTAPLPKQWRGRFAHLLRAGSVSDG